MNTKFAGMLSALLSKRDLPAAWLARKIGVHRSTVNRWLSPGNIGRPASPEIVEKIGRVLELDEVQTQKLLEAAFPALGKRSMSRLSTLSGDEVLNWIARPQFTEAASPLVGREAELAQLRNHLAHSRERKSRLVLVAGEAGIGKTRLVQEFIAEQPPETCLFCAAKSYPGEQTVPYLSLSEALDPLVSAGLIPKIDPIWLAEVAQVVRQLQVVHPELPLNPPIEVEYASARRFQGLTEFIVALASERAMVIWLDDLHWADEGTLDYLRYLLTRRRDTPVLIVGTYRPEDVGQDHPLVELKSTLIRENLVAEITLSSLAEQEVGRMVADLTQLDSALWSLGRRIYREIGGNPFFIAEQMKQLKEEGWLDESQWETIPLSSRIQELIRRRYRQIDEQDEISSQFIQAAAVVGARFNFDVVRLSGKLDVGIALGALDRLLAAGLIRHEQVGEYRFWHDQAQVVLYDDLKARISRERWQRWHQQVGEAIETLYPDSVQRETWLEQLAHNFFEAKIWPKALDYLLQAGQKALVLFTHGSARAHFEQAAELMTRAGVEPNLAQQVNCAEGLGDAYTHLGLFDLALPAYQQAVGLTETRDTSVARLGWKIARVYERQTKFNLAVSWLERSLLVLDQTSEKEVAARVHWLMGLIEVRRGQPEAALSWAEEALRLSQAAGQSASVQEVQTSRTWLVTGLVEQAQANNLMGVILRAREELPQAAEHCRRSAELYESLGHQRGLATAYANLATIAFDQEHWPQAATAYKRALALHQDTGNRHGQALVLCNLADVHYHQGRLEEARDFIEAGLYLATEMLETPFLEVLARETAGLIYLAQDDDEAAYEHLGEGLRLAEAHDVQEWLGLIQSLLAKYYLKCGRFDEAQQAAEQALNKAITQGSTTKEAVARRRLGRVYQAQGLPELAEAELRASMDLLSGKGHRYELARTMISLAAFYAEKKRRIEEGQAIAQQAIDIFQELGADLDLENAREFSKRHGFESSSSCHESATGKRTMSYDEF